MPKQAITVGAWVRYCGSRTELRGQLYEVIAVNGDNLTLQGAIIRVFCRASSVRLAPPPEQDS